ncbi:MAG: isochorismate synthase [Bacteroidaceae bacterium]|nr:isochorismate synthase [Bacteroidaceae bacterium]
MTNYALWRLPGQHDYTLMQQTIGRPVQLDSPEQLDGRSGFVLAPFSPSAATPILLLTPDRVEQHPVAETSLSSLPLACVPGPVDAAYARAFSEAHEAILGGRFRKLVLSHRQEMAFREAIDPQQLFSLACRLYPRQFVALINMEASGIWLMATPEILIEGWDVNMRTMSLAGTMPAPEAGTEAVWSAKNRAEQAVVTDYIVGRLQTCACDVCCTRPYTAQAAHLVHLRTDIRFRLSDCDHLGRLLHTLHPTPAVCGYPTHDARQWILGHEAHERRYYSGFCGVLNPAGHTHLHVSLRCMQLHDRAATLYAGGGLMPDSRLQSEWNEVQQKLQTMRNLFNHV